MPRWSLLPKATIVYLLITNLVDAEEVAPSSGLAGFIAPAPPGPSTAPLAPSDIPMIPLPSPAPGTGAAVAPAPAAPVETAAETVAAEHAHAASTAATAAAAAPTSIAAAPFGAADPGAIVPTIPRSFWFGTTGQCDLATIQHRCCLRSTNSKR
mmetsp:Transcript_58035/g.147439  ORF Transcript_58035/g.147439 Transcript_58035/m.147439 type:complete len:154 (-) Transcript_58035:1440-1901(-)